MENKETIVCPHCGRELPYPDERCPYCGKEIASHKKRILLLVSLGLIGVILIFSLYMLWTHVVLGKLIAQSPGTRLAPLEKMAEEPPAVMNHPQITQEQLDALDADAVWRNPEQLEAEHPNLTETEKTAIKYLISNLGQQGYSREKCLYYLDMDQISQEDAALAIELCQVDFKIQALKRALEYLSHRDFAPKELRETLMKDGFTLEEAIYAVENCGADWEYQTELALISLVHYTEISEQFARDILIEDGHDPDTVDKTIERLDPDWNREALQEALSSYQSLYKISRGRVSREDLDAQLKIVGFTPEQRKYAVDLIMPETEEKAS